MIRGLYTSASGMLTIQAQTELMAENVANVKTPGYKEQEASPMSFQEMLMNRVSTLPGNVPEATPLGTMGTGVYIGAINKIDRKAELVSGTSTDLALTAPGYFVIQTPEGLEYTRKGDFRLTEAGELVTTQGNPVMGLDGPITDLSPEFKVKPNGELLVDGIFVDRLRVVDVPLENLRQVDDAVYVSDGQVQPQQTNQISVLQGALEGSNVDITGQMTKIITAMRAYEANQKVIQTQDSTLEKAVNEIGKIY